MLKYTLASVHKITGEVKFFAHVFSLLTSSVMLGYLIFMCFADMGNLGLNLILAILTAVNFVIYIVAYNTKTKKMKRIKKSVNRAYSITKLFLNAISLLTVIYSISTEPSNVSNIKLVTIPLMIIMWILQLIIQILSIYVESRAKLFVDGIRMDFEPLIKSTSKVRNFIREATGEESVEPEEGVSDYNREILEEQAELDGISRKPKSPLLRSVIKKIISDRRKSSSENEKDKEPINK